MRSQTSQSSALLDQLYQLNQWMYNKPIISAIGNVNWDPISTIRTNFQQLYTSIQQYYLTNTVKTFCVQHKGLADVLSSFKKLEDALAGDNGDNLKDKCNMDPCSTLDAVQQSLSNFSDSIKLDGVVGDLSSKLASGSSDLTDLFSGYTAIFDYLSSSYQGSGYKNSTGSQILLADDNIMNQAFKDFYIGLQSLVDSKKGDMINQATNLVNSTTPGSYSLANEVIGAVPADLITASATIDRCLSSLS